MRSNGICILGYVRVHRGMRPPAGAVRMGIAMTSNFLFLIQILENGVFGPYGPGATASSSARLLSKTGGLLCTSDASAAVATVPQQRTPRTANWWPPTGAVWTAEPWRLDLLAFPRLPARSEESRYAAHNSQIKKEGLKSEPRTVFCVVALLRRCPRGLRYRNRQLTYISSCAKPSFCFARATARQ